MSTWNHSDTSFIFNQKILRCEHTQQYFHILHSTTSITNLTSSCVHIVIVLHPSGVLSESHLKQSECPLWCRAWNIKKDYQLYYIEKTHTLAFVSYTGDVYMACKKTMFILYGSKLYGKCQCWKYLKSGSNRNLQTQITIIL